jgi:hypothetical protein
MTSALGFHANWISKVYDTNPLFDLSKEVVPTQKWHFGAAHIYLHMYIYIVRLCIVYCIYIYMFSTYTYIYRTGINLFPSSRLAKKSNINHCTVNFRLVTVGGLKWRLVLVNEEILDLVYIIYCVCFNRACIYLFTYIYRYIYLHIYIY